MLFLQKLAEDLRNQYLGAVSRQDKAKAFSFNALQEDISYLAYWAMIGE